MSDLSPVILLDAIREQKLIRQAEESLADFAIQAWNVLEPATELKWGWALEAICEHLEAVSNGDIYRLVMNVPPGPMRDDSVIETSRGPVLLRDVIVGDLVLTHLGRYRPVSAVHHQGVLPILKITTNSGRETFAAPSHPYLTPRGWVDAGDLVIGDPLAVVNRQEDRPNAVPLSAEAARFLGYIVGDGAVTHSPGFVNGDREIIDDFITCATALGFKTSEVKRGTFWQVGLSNSREFLKSHNLLGKNSYTKRIPDAVMRADINTIANFLGAYWSCDGGIDVRPSRERGSCYRAYATTVSEGLANDLVQALALVGVESRLRKKARKLETQAQPGGIYRSFSIEVQNEAMTGRIVALPGLCPAKKLLGKDCRTDFDRPLWGDTIISIEPQSPANCMCLTVEEDHSFTCSGIAVKNSMKSLLTGVIWPAWEWGPRNLPSTRYLSTAHKQDLAVRDNMKCRRLIQSEWYQSRWPIKLTGDQNSKLKFENSSTGFREAMAFTSMTGSRGDRVILDDPLSVDDARSDAALDAAESTFREALPTRVNNDKSAIVVIMQRLHERDTTGIILKEKLGYEHLCLPMRFEPDRRCRTSIGFVDPRTNQGELMFPERFSEAQVVSLEKTMGEYASAGQLQQRPSPAGGGIIKIDHFQLWPNNKPLPVIDFVVQSVDPAYTEKTTNDPTAFCAWGVFTDGDKRGALLLDCWSDHLAFPQLREKLISEWHSLYGKTDTRTGKKPDVLLIEAKASGLSIIQDLRQANLPAIPYNPGNADKTNRAHQVTPILELDCLYIPESNKEPTKFVTWARPFLSQLEKFPNAEHDDFVDCFTQCIIYLRDLGKFELNFAEFDPVEDEDYYAKKKRRVNPYSQ